MTTVANRKQIKVLGENDVYIGRDNKPYGLAASPFANPYHIGKDGTRAEVIVKYEGYIRAALNGDVQLKRALWAMRGKRLVCWCAPQPCHGDVLVRLIVEAEAWVAAHTK